MLEACKDTLNLLTPKEGNNWPIVISNFNLNIFVYYFTTHQNNKEEYLSKLSYGNMCSALAHM